MRRVNLPLLLGVLAILVGGSIAVVVLHRYQVHRNASSMLVQVDEHLAQGEEEEAIAILGKYLVLRPGDRDTQRRYAVLHLSRAEKGQFTRQSLPVTVSAMEKAMRAFPEDDALRDRFATFLLDINQPGIARDHLQILADRIRSGEFRADAAASEGPAAEGGEGKEHDGQVPGPDPGAIALRLAVSSAAVGRFDEAEALLSKTVGFDPSTGAFTAQPSAAPAAAYMELAALVERRSGSADDARGIVERLPTDRPDDPEAWQNLIRWYVTHRDADAAEAALARARTTVADGIELDFLDYQVAMLREDMPRAEAILAGPLAEAPAVPPIVLARSESRRRAGDLDGSIAVLRDAIDAEPKQVLYRAALITTLADNRRVDELRELLTESRSLFPKDSVVVMYADAAIAMSERRWLPALRLLESLRPLVGSERHLSRQVDASLATCHAALGQLDQAAEARGRVARAGSANSQGILFDIDDLEMAGRPDEALALAESAVARIPDDKFGAAVPLWERLFRLSVAAQIRRPEAERDWSEVEGLLDRIAASPDVNSAMLERRRIDLLSAREGLPAALEASDIALATHPGEASLLGQRVMLLTSMQRVEDARRLIEEMPDDVRDSYDVIDAELRLGAFLPPRDSTVWLVGVESRLERLEGAEADRAARSLVAIHVGRGSIADAERIARDAVERNRENLPLQQVLLDLVADGDDPDAVAKQAETVIELAGVDSATGRAAKAAAIIARVTADRARRLEASPEDSRLSDDENEALGRARALLLQAGQERPRWADVPRRLATIAELQDDTSTAIGLLRQATDLRESLPLARRRLALLLLMSGRGEEARPVIESLGPAGGSVLERIKVETVLGLGRTEDALAMAEQLTPEDCRDADQLLWHASLLTRCRRIDSAVDLCRRAIDADAADPRAWAALVGVHLAGGAPSDARSAAAEARTMLAGRALERFDAMVADRLGDPREIEVERRAAVAAAPADLEAARALVETLLREKKTTQAREELRRMVALDVNGREPSLLWARRLLARQLAAGSHLDLLEALALLRRNVDGEGVQVPEDIALSIRLLLARPEPASWRQAVERFDELAKRRPLSVDERIERADVLSRIGMRARAREDLLMIAASPSSSPRVDKLLADVALEDGDLIAAGKWIEKVRTNMPSSVVTLRLDAKLALARGDRDRAGEVVSALVPTGAVSPADVVALRERAAIAIDLGFPETAAAILAAAPTLTSADTLALARISGRMHRLGDALDKIESVEAEVSPVALLAAVNDVVRATSGAIDGEDLGRIDALVDRLRRENPGAVEIAIQSATLDEALGRTASAERVYRELLADESLEPAQSAVASANLAWIIARPETAEEAGELVDRAIAVLGPISELIDTRALVRLAKNQKVLALEDMREAVLVPSAQKYLHLAVVAAEAGEIGDARRALGRARLLGLADERLSEGDANRLERLEARLSEETGES